MRSFSQSFAGQGLMRYSLGCETLPSYCGKCRLGHGDSRHPKKCSNPSGYCYWEGEHPKVLLFMIFQRC